MEIGPKSQKSDGLKSLIYKHVFSALCEAIPDGQSGLVDLIMGPKTPRPNSRYARDYIFTSEEHIRRLAVDALHSASNSDFQAPARVAAVRNHMQDLYSAVFSQGLESDVFNQTELFAIKLRELINIIDLVAENNSALNGLYDLFFFMRDFRKNARKQEELRIPPPGVSITRA